MFIAFARDFAATESGGVRLIGTAEDPLKTVVALHVSTSLPVAGEGDALAWIIVLSCHSVLNDLDLFFRSFALNLAGAEGGNVIKIRGLI